MKRNDTPQIAASASSMITWRRLTLLPNAAAVVGLPG